MRLLRCLMKGSSALAGAPKYIEHFSKFSPSPLSMKQFLDFGAEGRDSELKNGEEKALITDSRSR